MPKKSVLLGRLDEAYAMYEAGSSLAQVGVHFGLSMEAVRKQFVRNGLYIRTKAEQQGLEHVKAKNRAAHAGKRPSTATEFKVGQRPANYKNVPDEEIAALYADGLSAKAVGEVVGLSRPQVLRRLKKVGAEIRPSVEALTDYCATHKHDRHPNWRGGTTPVNVLIRQHDKYVAWRDAVFARDEYTCQYSEVRGGRLEVHHIGVTISDLIRRAKSALGISRITTDNKQAVVEFVLSMHTVDMGVTLTRQVHRDVHAGLIHLPGDKKRRNRRAYNKARHGSSGTVTTIAPA